MEHNDYDNTWNIPPPSQSDGAMWRQRPGDDRKQETHQLQFSQASSFSDVVKVDFFCLVKICAECHEYMTRKYLHNRTSHFTRWLIHRQIFVQLLILWASFCWKDFLTTDCIASQYNSKQCFRCEVSSLCTWVFYHQFVASVSS